MCLSEMAENKYDFCAVVGNDLAKIRGHHQLYGQPRYRSGHIGKCDVVQ